MKRRNVECGKMRRPAKRNKIADGLLGSTLLYLKFLLLWAMVILADFILEFRFEFLWPFWMLLRSVYDSFKYQGLTFSVFFVCIALTSDMICFFLIPVHWVFFAASTYVWVQYVWHTDKGICLPTMILCSVFVYMEGGVRLRDLRHMPAHVDLCRPFAAHCIGYPVVTLGFGLKSYIAHRIRLRRQRQVAKENTFYMQLLQEALPPPVHNQSVLKECADKNSTLAIEKVPEVASVTSNNSTTGTSVPEKHMNGNALHHLNNNLNSSHNTSSSIGSNSTRSSHSKKCEINRNTSQGADKNSAVSSNHQSDASSCHGDSIVPSQNLSGGASAKPSHAYSNQSNHSPSSTLATSLSSSTNSNKQHAHTNGVVAHAVAQSDSHSSQQSECELSQPERNTKGSKSNVSKQDKKESGSAQREESRKKNKNKDKENRESNNKDSKDTGRDKEKEIKETSNVQKDREIIKDSSQKDKDVSVFKEKESQSHKDIIREREVESQRERERETHRERESKKDRDREKEREELQQRHLEHKEICERQIRQLRAEITQLRSQNEQLSTRVNAARAAERAAISSMERRVNEERRRAEGCRQRRVALEAEVATLRTQLLQARERGQRLERDLQTAEHQVSTLETKLRENGPEAWRTAFNTLRDRAQQLERSLSAETRIKMDLFSAVGEAKRLSGLREGVIRSQEKEIEDLKGKIAQMLAVMPSDPFQQQYHMQMSHPLHPHQHPIPSPPSNNPLSNLDPNASVYTPKSVNQTTIKG